MVRPYAKKVMHDGENRISFNIFNEASQAYASKFYAFAEPILSSELHKGNGHRVRFNADPRYPQFLERIEAVQLPRSKKRRARNGIYDTFADRFTADVHKVMDNSDENISERVFWCLMQVSCFEEEKDLTAVDDAGVLIIVDAMQVALGGGKYQLGTNPLKSGEYMIYIIGSPDTIKEIYGKGYDFTVR